MITGIDRIQIVTPDRRRAAESWHRLFGTEVVREDRVAALAAHRTVLRAGATEIELLEPRGIGITGQHMSRSRSPLFAIGLAASDLEALRASLEARAIHHVSAGRQVFLSGEWLGIPGLRVMLSQEETLAPVGLLTRVYEATHLMRRPPTAADRLAKVLDLDPGLFVPIRSEEYGYQGILAMFARDRLDRIETIEPFDGKKTMGRFFNRQGPCLYMIYAEAADTGAIRDRLLAHAGADWSGPRAGAAPDNLFVHPKALGGVLLGVSRQGVAWRWSGQPDRAQAQPPAQRRARTDATAAPLPQLAAANSQFARESRNASR